MNNIAKLQEQLAHKTQECEELREDYEELKQRHNGAFQDFERLKQLYRKALEEIEEVWAKDEDGDYDFIKWQILNIINKAKGEE